MKNPATNPAATVQQPRAAGEAAHVTPLPWARLSTAEADPNACRIVGRPAQPWLVPPPVAYLPLPNDGGADYQVPEANAAFIVRACNENAQLHALVDANVIARCDAQDRADRLATALEKAAARIDTLSRRVSDAGKDDLAKVGVQWADEARAALQSAQA
jgi:hypothetical protein